MKKNIPFLVMLVGLATLVSCDIQKRLYRPGYLIAWKTHKKTSQVPCVDNKVVSNGARERDTERAGIVENPAKDGMLTAFHNADNMEKQLPSFVKVKRNDLSPIAEDCDTIVFRNGLQVKAKVIEITQAETKYKYCDSPEGALFSKANSEIKLIKHSNGSITELSTSETAAQTFTKEANKLEKRMSGKSQVTALILCIFIGFLGIHRFYLGYTGIGVLMLLTLGCCGILALIDLIRIITGDLKPKDGEYTEKL